MVDILRLVLTNFWPFVAAVFLLSVGITSVGTAVAEIVSAWRGADGDDGR